jgi:hypothetical protein
MTTVAVAPLRSTRTSSDTSDLPWETEPGAPAGDAPGMLVVVTDQQPAPIPLPELPERLEPDRLRSLDDAGLDAVTEALTAAERATQAAMAPYDRQLRELRARAAEVATERRRRERSLRHAARVAVREQATSGAMPTISEFLAAGSVPLPEERPLREVRAFLTTGGEVGFGYPTRPGQIGFTDGRQVRQAGTVGEARALYAQGWEPGAPGLAGVRVHLAGTRVEKLARLEDVVVEVTVGDQPSG